MTTVSGMTVCSVPVLHNTTANNAIQPFKENYHVHRYVLSNGIDPACRPTEKPTGVDRKSLRGSFGASKLLGSRLPLHSIRNLRIVGL